jgi:hypothetical protein
MNDLGSSPSMKALLEAARRDGPSTAARAKIWSGVSGAGVAAGTGTAAVGLAKMMTAGTLFGGAMTVGVAAALLYVSTAKAPDMTRASLATGSALIQPASVNVAPAMQAVAPVEAAPPPAETAIAVTDLPSAGPAPTATQKDPHAAPSRPRAHVSSAAYDSIGREASLVSTAQAALVRGDGAAALRAIAAASALPGRQLEPEELAVRAQALRLLGKKHDAEAIDAKLKSAYPLSALVRSR